MEWLALAIVVSTCLYLIDKNQKWKIFRRVLIWGTVGIALLIGTYAAWENHQEQKALAQPTPDFIPDKR